VRAAVGATNYVRQLDEVRQHISVLARRRCDPAATHLNLNSVTVLLLVASPSGFPISHRWGFSNGCVQVGGFKNRLAAIARYFS
jgi:hypothetical protein